MATVGNTSTPGHNWIEQGVNTPPNQMATAFTMPSGGGLITNLHAYFALVAGGSATAWCCLWDASGNLLGSVAVSVPNGTASVGGQQWNTGALSTPIYVAGGATIYLGFAVRESNGFYTTDESSGSSIWNTQSSPPASLSGNTSSAHNALGAYADYTPVTAHLRRSGAWVTTGTIYVRRSGAWVQASTLQVRRSGAWVNGS
jgi:hypothetical protein